jgi:hypothetical protein
MDELHAMQEHEQVPSLETQAERASRVEADRFRVVAIIAGVVCALAAVGEITTLVAALAKFGALFDTLGGQVPASASVLLSVGPIWVAVVFAVVAAALFGLFLVLARRYWIGLLFVPLFIYSFLGGGLANWLSIVTVSAITNMK